jgi:hypothetical protein
MSKELSLRYKNLSVVPQETIDTYGPTCETIDLTENNITYVY